MFVSKNGRNYIRAGGWWRSRGEPEVAQVRDEQGNARTLRRAHTVGEDRLLARERAIVETLIDQHAELRSVVLPLLDHGTDDRGRTFLVYPSVEHDLRVALSRLPTAGGAALPERVALAVELCQLIVRLHRAVAASAARLPHLPLDAGCIVAIQGACGPVLRISVPASEARPLPFNACEHLDMLGRLVFECLTGRPPLGCSVHHPASELGFAGLEQRDLADLNRVLAASDLPAAAVAGLERALVETLSETSGAPEVSGIAHRLLAACQHAQNLLGAHHFAGGAAPSRSGLSRALGSVPHSAFVLPEVVANRPTVSEPRALLA